MAWQRSKDPRFLAAADWSLRALERKTVKASPLYEVLLPYAVLTAARMNAELGRNYDVPKLANWCFDPKAAPQARPNWGVITGNWSGLDVDGLVGSATDGGGYAFAFTDNEGRQFRIVAGVPGHADVDHTPDRPEKVSHIVLNAEAASGSAQITYQGVR